MENKIFIYFKYKESTFIMSTLFHLYFLSNFNKDSYALDYEAIIREFAIKKYIYNGSNNLLYNKIIQMLNENMYTTKLCIHKHFPKDLIVSIMKPFLYYQYIYIYGIEGIEKTLLYKKILFYKLKKFYEYNPNFGKIIYNDYDDDICINTLSSNIKYNTDHLKFNSIPTDDINFSLDTSNYISHYYFSVDDIMYEE